MVNLFNPPESHAITEFCFSHTCSRAKEKRLKKDAGRTRWSQYFRSMKGGSSPSKLLDKDELKVDLDSFSHHGEFDSHSVMSSGELNLLSFVRFKQR